MTIYDMRVKLGTGKTIFDLPLLVTFYARVSTGSDEQANSLKNQIAYFANFIKSNTNWTYVEGYADEALSGTSVDKRESFLQMIDDARNKKFNFIITKEISRFSRSTLDSIKYTQELLSAGVGVFFQSDNINTLLPDSELRLTIMASIAQDEVRKLSERVSFGMQQAIAKGVVIGNNNIWGYEKKDGKLVVLENEAEVVRKIFAMYANENIGMRNISLQLSTMGMNNKNGNPITMSTIRRIITNPKYKGYYCGNKTHMLDYRLSTKVKKAQSEWVVYKDEESVPPIVTEELWEKANRILNERSEKQTSDDKTSYQNKYTYSGKIYCGEHNRPYYHDIFKYPSGNKENWRCRSRSECKTPIIYTTEVDEIIKEVYTQYLQEKESIVDNLVSIYAQASKHSKHDEQTQKLLAQIKTIKQKKDRLLDLNIDGRINDEEFEERNTAFNDDVTVLENKIGKIVAEASKNENLAKAMDKIKAVLQMELDFDNGFNNSIVDALIEKIVILKTDNKHKVGIQVHLKAFGQTKLFAVQRQGKKKPINTDMLNIGVCNLRHRLAVRRYQ